MAAMAGLDGIGGFLSLQYFRSTPVTVDYPARVLVLEDEQSLARRAESGFPVTCRSSTTGRPPTCTWRCGSPAGA